MARTPRRKSESGIYHVMLRGINKQAIFLSDADKIKFLQTLQKYKELCGIKIYGYCLMSNHVHLLIQETEEAPLEIVMKRIAVSYVYWYNLSYQRIGHLFQDRFRSEPVNDEAYFFTVLRYIHRNPLKGGLCHKMSGYPWSSFNQYKNNESGLIDINFALDILSHADLMDYFETENEDQCLDDTNSAVKATVEQQQRAYYEIAGNISVEQFADLPKSKQNEIIAKAKAAGIPEYKLAEWTGRSRYYIKKI